jgi:hypothetical protein
MQVRGRFTDLPTQTLSSPAPPVTVTEQPVVTAARFSVEFPGKHNWLTESICKQRRLEGSFA